MLKTKNLLYFWSVKWESFLSKPLRQESLSQKILKKVTVKLSTQKFLFSYLRFVEKNKDNKFKFPLKCVEQILNKRFEKDWYPDVHELKIICNNSDLSVGLRLRPCCRLLQPQQVGNRWSELAFESSAQWAENEAT